MIPPKVYLATPLGERTILEVNEWEEYVNIDEAGYELDSSTALINKKEKVLK